MKSLVVRPDGTLGFMDFPDCPPEAGQLAIRAACSLISPGTELHYIARAVEWKTQQPLGYCSSGWVEAVGDRVTGFSEGDRVIAMGWNYAVHANRICVPYRLCLKIPSGMPF